MEDKYLHRDGCGGECLSWRSLGEPMSIRYLSGDLEGCVFVVAWAWLKREGFRAVAWPAESTRQGMTHTGTATTAHLEKSSSIATRRPLDRVLVRHRCLLSPTDIE
jgi:hypothetical protein